MAHKYNESSLKELTDLNHIVHRPSAYIPDTDYLGRQTIAREIIDNASDEMELLGSGIMDVFLFLNRRKKDYQVVVRDTGRSIPVGKLIDVFSKTKISGKFDQDSYQFSAGSLGYGSSVTLALSKWFRAIALNQDVIGDVTLHRDKIPTSIDTISNQLGHTGTIVMFSPDDDILTGNEEYINNLGNLEQFLSHLSLFSKFRTRLIVVEQPIPESIRQASSLQVIELSLIHISEPTRPY